MQRRIIRAGFNDRMNALPKSQQNEVGGRINEAFEGILKNMMAEVNGLGEGGLEVTVEASRRFADQVQRTIKSVFSNDPDYKRLQEIERRRRAILKRKDASFFRTLLFWDGTVLHAVIRESMLYITLLIYVAVRVFARIGLPEFVSDIGTADITTIGAFVTFFMVLHTNNGVQRFTALYGSSMSIEGRIFDTAALAVSSLPQDRALRLIRYANAVHIAGYVGLGKTYTYKNFFLPINETQRVLNKQELMRIESIGMDEGGSCYRELIVWCCDEVQDALNKGVISEMIAHDLRQLILKLRVSFATIYDYADQPVPFFLTHFVVLVTFIFLPLVAVSLGLEAGTGENSHWTRDIVQGIVVLLQTIVFLGMRALSHILSDP